MSIVSQERRYAGLAPIVVKQGDTEPEFEVTLADQFGDPLDLTGREVRFWMAPRGDPQTKVLDSPVEVVDAAAGVVSYQFAVGETDAVGEYVSEFVIDPHPDLAGGQTASQRTIPAGAFLPVVVEESEADGVEVGRTYVARVPAGSSYVVPAGETHYADGSLSVGGSLSVAGAMVVD